MMSSYFYPGSAGEKPRYKADELGNRNDAQAPQQLSLFDRMKQHISNEPHVIRPHRN